MRAFPPIHIRNQPLAARIERIRQVRGECSIPAAAKTMLIERVSELERELGLPAVPTALDVPAKAASPVAA